MNHQEPTVFTLSNGLRIVYLHADKQVSHLGVTILGGSRFETEKEVGLAHFLEHCIFKGTSKRKAFHILSRLDSVGGELNAYTSKEEICIYGSFSFEHFNRTSELLADITFNSTFPQKEVEKEKGVVLDEINSYKDSPSDKIFDDFEAILFKNHALGNNILGTEDSVNSFTSKDLLAYTNKFFHPENMVISYVGNLSLKKVEKQLEKDFGKINRGEFKVTKVSNFNSFKAQKVVSTEANIQSHLLLGGVAPGYDNKERRIFSLLVNVLGGPALNSRLVLSIREKYGYSYSVEANYTPYKETGFWSVYAGTDEKYLKKTEKLIHKEIAWFRDNLLSPTKLKNAKQQFKGHLALGMDSNSGMMLGLGKSLLVFNEIDTIEQILTGIEAITSEDIQRVAKKYFDVSNISTLIFSPEN